MGAVYFSLRNITPKYNSSLANIHLCLLFNSFDREKYGFAKEFLPLLDDIKIIERYVIDIKIKWVTHIVWNSLHFDCWQSCLSCAVWICKKISANKFCHNCLVDKTTSQSVFNENDLEKRDGDNYQQHVVLKDFQVKLKKTHVWISLNTLM